MTLCLPWAKKKQTKEGAKDDKKTREDRKYVHWPVRKWRSHGNEINLNILKKEIIMSR